MIALKISGVVTSDIDPAQIISIIAVLKNLVSYKPAGNLSIIILPVNKASLINTMKVGKRSEHAEACLGSSFLQTS
jgi:hypothetical protein